MTVTAIRPASRQPALVDVEALSQHELEVAFYAADYHRTGDEVMAGGDVLRMSAAVVQVVTDLGVELVRQIAALVEYATLHSDLSLRDRLMPDAARRSHAQCNARCLRALLCRPMPALHAARQIATWRQALTAPVVEAVAA